MKKIKNSTMYGVMNGEELKPKRKYKKCNDRYELTINDIKDENIRNALWKLTNPEFIENYNDHVNCFQLILGCLIDYEKLLDKYI